MMLYVLIPYTAQQFRIFTTYSAAEQAVLVAARDFERYGLDPNWCYLVAYDGQDELVGTFLYTLVGSSHLKRERFLTPSS
jgi:hypothetical protein